MSTRNSLIALAILIIFVGCGDDYSLRNARINPTYVCSGDATRPYATWDYSGPRGRVKIRAANGDILCEAGARTNYCGPFSRGLTAADVPLKAEAYKHGNKMGDRDLAYLVLSGPRPTENFMGSYEFGDPHQKCVESKFTNTDGTVETRTDCYDVVTTTQVTWPISADWFSHSVQTRSVQYTRGNTDITLTGPGLSAPLHLNVNNAGPGNNSNPGGLWVGTFNPALDMRPSDVDISQPDFRIQLTVACQ